MKKVVKKIKKSPKSKKKVVRKVTKTKKAVKILSRAKTKAKQSVSRAKFSSRAKKVVKKLVKKPVSRVVVSHPPKLKLKLKPKARKIFGPVNVKPYHPKKNEEYMSEEQLEHFRTVLLQWKSQLMAEVDRTMHHMKDESSNYPDPVDRASQEEEFSLELRARDRDRKLLRKIEEALIRIDDHDYGYCDVCGAEIGIKRLEARPTATQCIECKTISEIREKQVGEGG